jgi:putative ABC transport system substrate-binding protein
VNRVPLILFLWLCAAVPAFAQDAANLPIVGVLRVNTRDTVEPTQTMFRDALAALGQVDGRNIRIEVRLAEGHPERFPELAKALVRERASVIAAMGPPAIRAAQQATSTIPIVATGGDLVGYGLISNLAKPGGNTTGVSLLTTELDAKRLEILKEILPLARRFGLLHDAAESVSPALQASADTARALGVELQTMNVSSATDFARAFASFRTEGAEAVSALSSPMLFYAREELARASLAEKLPAICEWREMAESGCLASYGVTLRELAAIQAVLTDKMLRGAPPGEMPAQQPTRFELVINQKVARAIGVQIPHSILGRADEVIE